MRRTVLCLAAITVLLAPVHAQVTGHYVNGVEGILGASLPPPGLYYRNYEVYYWADRLNDRNGNKAPVGFDVSVYAMTHRLIWVSKTKLLGGNYGADIIVPVVNTNLTIKGPGVHDSEFGLGDICVEPFILSWHGPQWDAVAAMGFWAPTGNFSATRPASPGKGFWTLMPTFGATGYLDPQRKWSVSFLGRYEVHTRNGDTHVTPGQDFHFEWGLGKSLGGRKQIWDLGLAGYAQWQLTDDDGPGVTWDRTVHDSAFAVGPEVRLFLPASKMILSARGEWEFDTTDRSQGIISNLTGTWFF